MATAGLRMGTSQVRWVLVATVLGSGLAMLDATVVNVALARIGTDLGAGFAALQGLERCSHCGVNGPQLHPQEIS